MLVYLDVAYGFIVTGHIIYVVRTKLSNDWYEYRVLPWQYHPERLSCDKEVKVANYIVGMMEIIRWVASIAMHQQLNLAKIKEKYKSCRDKPEGRKQPHQLNSVVYPLNCTLYMGTDSIILDNLPLAHVTEVLCLAKFEIMKQLCSKMNEEELKEEFD